MSFTTAYKYGVKKLVFLGSSCIYPGDAPQPLKEEYLLTSELEYTNEPYAIAKIAGIKMCESFNLQYNTNFICADANESLWSERQFRPGEVACFACCNPEASPRENAFIDRRYGSIRRDFNRNPVEGIDGNADEDALLEKMKKYGIRRENDRFMFSSGERGKPQA